LSFDWNFASFWRRWRRRLTSFIRLLMPPMRIRFLEGCSGKPRL
jgi:hypothetical protein